MNTATVFANSKAFDANTADTHFLRQEN